MERRSRFRQKTNHICYSGEFVEKRICQILDGLRSLKTRSEHCMEEMREIQSQVEALERSLYSFHSDYCTFGNERSEPLTPLEEDLHLSGIGLTEEQMMTFRPPAKIIPASRAITPAEILSVVWYRKWRLPAIGYKNLTTKEELLLHVYGCRKGRATHEYRDDIAQSLNQRLDRVLAIASTVKI